MIKLAELFVFVLNVVLGLRLPRRIDGVRSVDRASRIMVVLVTGNELKMILQSC